MAVYVCICEGVPDVEVRACIAAGARTVDDVGQACGAGTGCGSCHDLIDVLLLAEPGPARVRGLPISA